MPADPCRVSDNVRDVFEFRVDGIVSHHAIYRSLLVREYAYRRNVRLSTVSQNGPVPPRSYGQLSEKTVNLRSECWFRNIESSDLVLFPLF